MFVKFMRYVQHHNSANAVIVLNSYLGHTKKSTKNSIIVRRMNIHSSINDHFNETKYLQITQEKSVGK